MTDHPSASDSHQLKRTVTWKSAFVVSLGGSMLVAVSLGPMAAALGPASVFVWTLTAMVGVLSCLMIAELATMFPDKAGGTATYAHEGFKDVSPMIGAVSNWGYWLGWIPVIPVNLVLSAGYIQAAFWPEANILWLAIGMSVPLFILNYFGLRPGVWCSIIMATCALVPLVVISGSPLVDSSLFHRAFVTPFVPLDGSWSSGSSWLLMIKWMFVAVWSSYAFESASAVIAELKDPAKDGPKAMMAASAVGVLAFMIVPFMLLAIVGTDVLSKDASVAFLPAATTIFGQIGGMVVSIMLIAALLLGAQTAIIGASRTLYEMSRDGLTLTQFAKLNRFGVPDRTMIWVLLVTVASLLIFRADIVNLVAASNVGYLLVFLLVIPAFARLRYIRKEHPRPFKLPGIFVGIAVLVTLFNAVVFVVGGLQWGGKVMAIGSISVATFLPFYLYRRKIQDRRPMSVPAGDVSGQPRAEKPSLTAP
ncbi:MAG: APC family permease [Planctomycetes bacterium]|nr:APC family permease [Planctomycetota bacterium]